LAPPPRGNDPTLTIFDGWQELNPPKVYAKYENNPFQIVVWSLRKPNSFWRRRRRRTGPKPKYPRLRRGIQLNLLIRPFRIYIISIYWYTTVKPICHCLLNSFVFCLLIMIHIKCNLHGFAFENCPIVTNICTGVYLSNEWKIHIIIPLT
jgi:hypothetical protein